MLDIDQRVELVDRDIVHTGDRSSDSVALELDTVLAELDTAGLVAVDRTSAGKLVDRAGFAEDSRGNVGKLFVDTAVAVMENFVVAVADWELEKLVEPEPIQMRWEFELCTADLGPVEIDWEPAMWVGLEPIQLRLEFELGMAARELAKSAVLGLDLEVRFAQFAADFEGHREAPAAVVASGWVQVDH